MTVYPPSCLSLLLLSSALTPSPTLYLCIHASLPLIFLPWETRKPSSNLLPHLSKCTTEFISACLQRWMLQFIMLNSVLPQYDLAQINSRRKATQLSLYRKNAHSSQSHKIQQHPCSRLLLLAAGLTCFDVVWCIDRSAARSWMTSSRDHKSGPQHQSM